LLLRQQAKPEFIFVTDEERTQVFLLPKNGLAALLTASRIGAAKGR